MVCLPYKFIAPLGLVACAVSAGNVRFVGEGDPPFPSRQRRASPPFKSVPATTKNTKRIPNSLRVFRSELPCFTVRVFRFCFRVYMHLTVVLCSTTRVVGGYFCLAFVSVFVLAASSFSLLLSAFIRSAALRTNSLWR
uniref:Secreted protein n=1 Tax=Ixodes ricinus TaxID=34613 RepID=A0A6B0USP9_IXORI